MRDTGRVVTDHEGAAMTKPPLDEDKKFGTVGAVALDMHGHLAAATSTGGMTNKRVGRVGDSPLIGSGTYADDRTAAISCTGSGEMFIRVAAAHDICARMAYGGATLEAATHAVVHGSLPAIGGTGGLIAVTATEPELAFNTKACTRHDAGTKPRSPPSSQRSDLFLRIRQSPCLNRPDGRSYRATHSEFLD